MPDREQLERWLLSEDEGQDDAADQAFAHLFAAVPKVEAGPAFVQRTVAEVWRRRARRRRILALGWAAAVIAAAGGVAVASVAAAPASAWAVKTGVRLLSHAGPWLIAYATEAMNLWSVVARIGGHVAAALATPPRAAAIVGVELVGILAFFALQRLVGFEPRGEAQI